MRDFQVDAIVTADAQKRLGAHQRLRTNTLSTLLEPLLNTMLTGNIVMVDNVLGGSVDIVSSCPESRKARELFGTKDILREGIVRSSFLQVAL